MDLYGSDACPPRLTLETQNELRSAFRAYYPGELLDSNSTPGQRYWALVYHSLKPNNRLAWTPWNQIISEKKHMELMEKIGRRPRSSMELLTQMCWEDVPQIDEAFLSARPGASTRSCRYTATPSRSLEGLAQTYDSKLLACHTQQYASDSGLCAPNLAELMSADRLLMETTYQLVNEENWRILKRSSRHGRGVATAPKAKSVRTGSRRQSPPQRGESKGKGDRKGTKKE